LAWPWHRHKPAEVVGGFDDEIASSGRINSPGTGECARVDAVSRLPRLLCSRKTFTGKLFCSSGIYTAMDLRHQLAAADQLLREAQSMLDAQADVVARLKARGYDNASAEALLDALREGVRLLTVDRERLERELAEGEAANKRYSSQR
jgi:hypothetical protein